MLLPEEGIARIGAAGRANATSAAAVAASRTVQVAPNAPGRKNAVAPTTRARLTAISVRTPKPTPEMKPPRHARPMTTEGFRGFDTRSAAISSVTTKKGAFE